MGLNPQVIGKEMPHGFAGCYARQPDMIVNTRPAGGGAPIPFGTPLKYDGAEVVPMGAAATAAQFVKCQRGTPALGGAVYVRITANGSFSTAAVGGFEAEDDSGKVVQLTNCQWAGPADANGVAELRILTMNNA